jgi:(1->4)-alpha-D-glucan 1-alpha-D-glucosylmutase
MPLERTATYRVQFRPGFGFHEAAAVLPYLAELGVSHLYASPYLQAAAGSAHGYDVVDPTRVNEELGGADGHAALCEALKRAGMGQVLDVVPNHMAIVGRQNPWWWDVLENGPSSRYANYFDVDWENTDERWQNRVLLPVLGDHYGRVLEDGALELRHAAGVFTLHYYEHAFPIDPSTLDLLLSNAAEAADSEFLGFLAGSCARLPRPSIAGGWAVERRHRDKAVLQTLLTRVCEEEPEAAAAIDAETARFNADPDVLDTLIDSQNYRLALWRTAGRDLGYRRFFDVHELAGLRVEEEEVFNAIHALPIRWVREGVAQGLRIDHPDGLRDPAQYFDRLKKACPGAWIVAEKILEPGERLPGDWPIAGTTGYEFLNLAGGLFVDPRGEAPLTRFYEELTGETSDYHGLVDACKATVLRELLGSELNRLTALLIDICERHRRYRDYTRHELQAALCELAACFPVYRSYVRAPGGEVSETDAAHIQQATAKALERAPDVDPELFRFLESILLLRTTGSLESELVMRFQQLTGPAMAKGVEDTAMYRFNRLVCLNEVGGDPSRFGVTPEMFHEACSESAARHPETMLATSTHDTKRSEDVRARIALLSEVPARWAETVLRWRDHNARHRAGDWPDANTEYLIYQTLVGAWPIDADRMTAYMEKAIREAKVHTSWTKPNEPYETAVRDFTQAIFADDAFTKDLRAVVAPLEAPGRVNSLAQALLKLTAPGVPDVYQGCELWDLSLVDPDNRRPVDFALRRKLLAEVKDAAPEAVMERAGEGAPKLWLTARTLRLRQERPCCFGPEGGYTPLAARGEKAAHAVAFCRGEGVAAVVPRLVLGLDGAWGDAVVDLPDGRWRNVLTGETAEGAAPLSGLLKRFPVALLAKENSD